jgi:hypothetical protein
MCSRELAQPPAHKAQLSNRLWLLGGKLQQKTTLFRTLKVKVNDDMAIWLYSFFS